MLRCCFAVVCWVLLLSQAGRAQEAQKKPEAEKIPAPKKILPPIYYIESVPHREDTREVWQHYGVNSLGRFVPRVIVLPYGSYYSRDLQPYPWTTNRSTAFMPYVVD